MSAKQINIDHETSAVFNFLKTTWDIPADDYPVLQSLIGNIQEAAWKGWEAVTDKTPEYFLAWLEDKLKGDAIATNAWAGWMLLELHKISTSEGLPPDWNFEKQTKLASASVIKSNPKVKKWRPHGWADAAENYQDYDGMEELNQKELATKFNGTLDPSRRARPFVMAISLPHVLYDFKCQGRSVITSLTGALFSHFLGLRSLENGWHLDADIKRFLACIDSGKPASVDGYGSIMENLLIKLEQKPEFTASIKDKMASKSSTATP